MLMMKNNYIKDIISAFYDSKASENTQFLFRKWYRLNEYQKEKDSVLKELWENTSSVVSENTLEDFSKIKTLISKDEIRRKRHRTLINIFSYAAIVTLILASTFYLRNQLNNPIALEYNISSVSHGQSSRITLDDGTVVVINAGSTFFYPNKFLSDTRTVYLTGQANFYVAKNAKKPFIVRTKHMDITAIGTTFTVESYPNSNFTKATLVEGCIKIEMENDKKESFILNPNNQLTYNHVEQNISITNVDALRLASWEEGHLIFQGSTFDEIASTIEKRYNVIIHYNADKINKNSYYVKFTPNETLEEVLEVLSILTPKSSYKIDENIVYFYLH